MPEMSNTTALKLDNYAIVSPKIETIFNSKFSSRIPLKKKANAEKRVRDKKVNVPRLQL